MNPHFISGRQADKFNELHSCKNKKSTSLRYTQTDGQIDNKTSATLHSLTDLEKRKHSFC